MNKEEWSMLWGLPHEAQLLYCAIRRRMDYSTGMVGTVTKLSWNALTEDLEVEASPGRKAYRPTKNKLRHYADVLVKHGLLANHSDKASRTLIFKCLEATRDESVSERFNISSTCRPNIGSTSETPEQTRPAEESEQEVQHTKNPEVQHTSVYPTIECVSDTLREHFFLKFQHMLKNGLMTDEELCSHIDDYLAYCKSKNTQPNYFGLRSLLESRLRYRGQAIVKQQAISELRQAETDKFTALADRESLREEHIASETIYRQSNPLRH